jgi:hypothetical protein
MTFSKRLAPSSNGHTAASSRAARAPHLAGE